MPSQDFVMRNIPREFEISTYNTLCSRGPTKVLAESRKNARGGHLVFQNAAKNTPRQDFMVVNISYKFEKASYNIFFVGAVMVKFLYTLWRRRRNEAKSIVSTGCYPGIQCGAGENCKYLLVKFKVGVYVPFNRQGHIGIGP